MLREKNSKENDIVPVVNVFRLLPQAKYKLVNESYPLQFPQNYKVANKSKSKKILVSEELKKIQGKNWPSRNRARGKNHPSKG